MPVQNAEIAAMFDQTADLLEIKGENQFRPAAGRHHYRFHVYALDLVLGRRPQGRDDFLSAIAGHVLDEGELVGLYQRATG